MSDELNARIAELEDENEALQRQVDELEDELARAENELRALTDDYDEMQAAAAAFEGDLSAGGSDEERVYLASKVKQHFHRQTCKWAQFLIGSINLIEFSSHAEAVAAGYKPCKTCRA